MMIKTKNKIMNTLQLFHKDTRGIAAVEFAYVAPLLIVLWLGTIQLSYVMSLDRKVSRIASTVADLITQSERLDNDEVQDILKVSEDIMFPYEEEPEIVVSGIDITGGNATTVWTCRSGIGTCSNGGDNIDVPQRIKLDDSFLVTASVTVTHTPIVGILSLDSLTNLVNEGGQIELSERLFLRPRRTEVCIGSAADCS